MVCFDHRSKTRHGSRADMCIFVNYAKQFFQNLIRSRCALVVVVVARV